MAFSWINKVLVVCTETILLFVFVFVELFACSPDACVLAIPTD
jgi:hypothetical protein